jgi:hypothetical protein
VLFLSLAWRCNLAIKNSQVQRQTSCFILYRKSLDDYIYKQWELWQVMVIKLVIDFGELVKMALKWFGQEKRLMGAGRCLGLMDFVALVCVWFYFYCCRGCLF